MRPVVLEFIRGVWNGKSLRTDSPDQEEAWLAAGCYEMCHHGEIGAECNGLAVETTAFARSHRWPTQAKAGLGGHYRYVVSERRETAEEVHVILMHASE